MLGSADSHRRARASLRPPRGARQSVNQPALSRRRPHRSGGWRTCWWWSSPPSSCRSVCTTSRGRIRKSAPYPATSNGYRAIDTDDVEAVRRRRSSGNRIWNTAARRAQSRVAARADAVGYGAWRRVRPFKNVEAARIRFLSMAESQRLINASDTEFRPLLIAALQTGARYQELARLKVADFNPGCRYIGGLAVANPASRAMLFSPMKAPACSSSCAPAAT